MAKINHQLLLKSLAPIILCQVVVKVIFVVNTNAHFRREIKVLDQ